MQLLTRPGVLPSHPERRFLFAAGLGHRPCLPRHSLLPFHSCPTHLCILISPLHCLLPPSLKSSPSLDFTPLLPYLLDLHSLVEVLKSSSQLQARKDHDGLQVPLKLPQHFHSRGSANQAALDLLVDVPGKLLTYLGAMERAPAKHEEGMEQERGW